ncbi:MULTISPECIES: hypothetical protein [unclassified Streptomyces]|uniref:hypothetical protein n=1 Tax=unclassified Streptomyces TaxID=2593676 RepID=UPI00278C471E|nr:MULTISPECIES: hypothetical protein [unclassified Streptomyces]
MIFTGIFTGLGLEINSTEAERPLDRIQRGEQPGPLDDQQVPLKAGLLAGPHRRDRLPDGVRGDATQLIDALIERVDVFLFFLQFQAVPA